MQQADPPQQQDRKGYSFEGFAWHPFNLSTKQSQAWKNTSSHPDILPSQLKDSSLAPINPTTQPVLPGQERTQEPQQHLETHVSFQPTLLPRATPPVPHHGGALNFGQFAGPPGGVGATLPQSNVQDPASGMWMQGRDGSGGLGSGDMAGSRVLLGSGEFIGNQSGFIGGGAMLGSGGAMLGSGDMVGSRVLVGSMPDMAGGGQLQMGSREMMREDPGAHPPLATQGESEQHPPGSHFFSWKAGGTRPTVCQVPGCGVDLSGMKEYYMRYKICQEHCQMPCLVRDGVPQRFCQQCGRFQQLSDFDGDKRTCRRKLERHNARRRKKSAGVRQATVTPRHQQQRRLQPLATAAPAGNAAWLQLSQPPLQLPRLAPVPTPACSTTAEAMAVDSPRGGAAGESGGENPMQQAPQEERWRGMAGLKEEERGGGERRMAAKREAAAGAGAGGGGPRAPHEALCVEDSLMQIADELGLEIPRAEDFILSEQAQQVERALQGWRSVPPHLPAGGAPLAGSRLGPPHPRIVGAGPTGSLPVIQFSGTGAHAGGSVRRGEGVLRGAGRMVGTPMEHGMGGVQGEGRGEGKLHRGPRQDQTREARPAPRTPPFPLSLSPLQHTTSPGGDAGGTWGGAVPPAGAAWETLSGSAAAATEAFQSVLVELLASPDQGPILASLERSLLAAPPASPGILPPQPSVPAPPAMLAEPAASSNAGGGGRRRSAVQQEGEEGGPGVEVQVHSVQGRPWMHARHGQQHKHQGASMAGEAAQPGTELLTSFHPTAGAASRQSPAEVRCTPLPLPAHADLSRRRPQQGQRQWGLGEKEAGRVGAAPQADGAQHAQRKAQRAQRTALQESLDLLSSSSGARDVPMQDDRVHRLSLKLFGVPSDSLPSDLKGDMLNLMGGAPGFVESCMRPGCIHITLSGLLQRVGGAPPCGIRASLQTLLGSSPELLAHLEHALFTVQVGDELAVVDGGRVLQVYRLSSSQGVLPAITSVSPFCLPTSGEHGLVVRGHNLLGPTHSLFCRHGGGFPLLEIRAMGSGGSPPHCGGAPAAVNPSSGSAAEEGEDPGVRGTAQHGGGWQGYDWLEVALPGDKPPGLYQMEVQRGALMCSPKPLLVLPDPQAVQEVRQLERDPAGMDVDAFLEGVGVVVDYMVSRQGRAGVELDRHRQQRRSTAGAARSAAGSEAGDADLEEVAEGTVVVDGMQGGGTQQGGGGQGVEGEAHAAHNPSLDCHVGGSEQEEMLEGSGCGGVTAGPGRGELEDEARVRHRAAALVACCVARGWPAMTAMLLPAATMGVSPQEAVEALEAACPPRHSLLCLAVTSHSPHVLLVLGAWGRAVGHEWDLCRPAPSSHTRLTPLHLAAVAKEPLVLRALAALNLEAFQAVWRTCRTADGHTPAELSDLALHAQQARQAPPALEGSFGASAAVPAQHAPSEVYASSAAGQEVLAGADWQEEGGREGGAEGVGDAEGEGGEMEEGKDWEKKDVGEEHRAGGTCFLAAQDSGGSHAAAVTTLVPGAPEGQGASAPSITPTAHASVARSASGRQQGSAFSESPPPLLQPFLDPPTAHLQLPPVSRPPGVDPLLSIKASESPRDSAPPPPAPDVSPPAHDKLAPPSLDTPPGTPPPWETLAQTTSVAQQAEHAAPNGLEAGHGQGQGPSLGEVGGGVPWSACTVQQAQQDIDQECRGKGKEGAEAEGVLRLSWEDGRVVLRFKGEAVEVEGGPEEDCMSGAVLRCVHSPRSSAPSMTPSASCASISGASSRSVVSGFWGEGPFALKECPQGRGRYLGVAPREAAVGGVGVGRGGNVGEGAGEDCWQMGGLWNNLAPSTSGGVAAVGVGKAGEVWGVGEVEEAEGEGRLDYLAASDEEELVHSLSSGMSQQSMRAVEALLTGC